MNLHKTNTKWLVHSWSTFGARTNHGQPEHTRLTTARTWGSHHLPPYSILCATPRGPHPNGHFVLGLPSGSPEIPIAKTPATLRAHNFLCRPPIAMRSEEKLYPLSRAFQRYVARCLNFSQLLVVGSQTANLTLGHSFGHNLCYRCPNGQCKPILGIYASRAFWWYKERLKERSLTPEIAFWRFESPFRTPTPNMGVHLGVWGFIPSHSLHSREHVKWLPGLPLGPQPCHALPWLRAQG
jgi:hypothetical protein